MVLELKFHSLLALFILVLENLSMDSYGLEIVWGYRKLLTTNIYAIHDSCIKNMSRGIRLNSLSGNVLLFLVCSLKHTKMKRSFLKYDISFDNFRNKISTINVGFIFNILCICNEKAKHSKNNEERLLVGHQSHSGWHNQPQRTFI